MSGLAAPLPRARSTDRAREIERVAAQLFFTHGYEATTTRQIAQALEMTSASLYYHYPDKEQILFELISSTMEQLTAGLQAVLEKESEPERELVGLVAHHVALHGTRPTEATLGETELRSLTGARRAEAQRMRDTYEELVVQVLQAGVKAGRFDLPDLKLSAYCIIAQSTNVGIWYSDGGPLSLEEIAVVYAKVALRIVAADPLEDSVIAALAGEAAEFHRRRQ
jgi:TetR/AcrR family transcriptional regulator, cholesterol catabolism regulator